MAAGDVLWKEGTPIVWGNAIGGGIDEELDLGGADGDAGDVCVGSYRDFGATPRAVDYRLDIFIDGFETAPVVGEQIDVYISESSDGSVFTGPETPADTADSTGSTARLPNLLGPFPATVWSTTAGNNIVVSYEFRTSARYLAPVVHNNTADDLLATADAHTITITPLFPSVQQS